MRASLTGLAFLAALLGGASGAAAQQQCNLTSGANARLNQVNPGTPQSMIFIGGLAQFTCPDGKVIRGDSAVIVESTQQRFLIGHAYYSDAEKTLTGDRMTFFGREGRLTAEQNVVVTDKTNGSVIRGQFLNYAQPAAGQPSRAIVYGNRPHAVLHGKGSAPTRAPAAARDSTGVARDSTGAARDSTGAARDSTGAARDSTGAARDSTGAARDSTAAAARDSAARRPAAPDSAARGPAAPPDTTTTIVDADQMQLIGQQDFHATGNVKLVRGELKGEGQQIDYSQVNGHMKLIGNARMEGSNFTLEAGTIDGTMKDNQLESVRAESRGKLVADEVRVNAPVIQVAFIKGKVQRLIALSAKRADRTATDGDARAEALARDMRLVADSIDALLPEQRMERLVAVGGAYGERTNDSIKAKLPEVASRDWLRGDTIIGVFARPGMPLAAADSALVVVAADTARTASDSAGVAAGDSAGAAHAKAQKKAKAATKPAPGKVAGGPAAADTTAELRAVVALGGSTPASSIYRMQDRKKPDQGPAINYLLAKRIALAFRDGDVTAVRAQGEIRGVHLQPEAVPADSTTSAKKKGATEPGGGAGGTLGARR